MKDLLLTSFLKFHNRIAYKNGNTSITFEKLYSDAKKLAKELSLQGTGPVVLYGHKEIMMITGIVACIFAGRAYVPIDVSMPEERIKEIINQSGASFIINAGEGICPVACNVKEDLFGTNNIAYYIFTSGSTGKPKGIPISYSNLKNFCNWIVSLDGFKIATQEVVLNQANFNFDLSVVDIFFSLLNGHTLIGLCKEDQNDYERLFSIVKKETVSFMVLTPTFLNILLSEPEFNSVHYPFLKCIYLCGEVLSPKIALKALNRFPELILINAYGPTEATSAVSAVTVTENICKLYDTIPIGKMTNNATQIALEENEIVLSGPSVFSGYLGDIRGGYEIRNGINTYRTGDLGYIIDDYLFFNGREDYQIKYKGYRIELEEIENVVMNIPDVNECIVVPKFDANGKVLFLKAYFTGEIESLQKLKALMLEKLPAYMIPKTIKKLDRMPVNANGKIDRKEILKYD